MDVIIEQSELVELSNKDLENQHKVNYEKVQTSNDGKKYQVLGKI